MFTEKQCRPRQLVEINQFSSLERKWKTEKFFKPRIENFHGCTLWFKFAWLEATMPFLSYHTSENNTWYPKGAVVDMLKALSTHLNFTYLYGPAAEIKLRMPDSVEDGEDLVIAANMNEGLSNPSSYPI